MQIGSEMATLQEKNPKMDPKKRFFLKNPPGFLAFEKSSSKLTSNRPFWLTQIYRDIKFILRGLPERCVETLGTSRYLNFQKNNIPLYTLYMHEPLCRQFSTNLHEILAPCLKSNFQTSCHKLVVFHQLLSHLSEYAHST